jgi:hypothetical protein
VRGDDDVGVLAASHRDGDGRGQAARRAATIDDLPNGTDVDAVVLEHLDKRFLDLGGADSIEELEQPGRRAADVVAALGHYAQEGLAAAAGASEPIEAAVLASAAFLVDQALEVLSVLDLLATVPAANMLRNNVVAVRNADYVQIGEDDERPLDAVVRYGVVVEIKANVGRFSDLNLDALMRGKRLVSKGQQDTALVLERLPNRARAILDPRPVEGRRAGPGHGLLIEIGEAVEGPGRKKCVAHVANGALDAALFVSASGRDWTRLEAIVRGHLE